MKKNFNDLVAILARLRGDDGCPWDKEQTTASLLPYLIEESNEFIEAVQSENPAAACEELGDVLLQIVFHAQIAAEKGEFTIDDVVDGIAQKMVRRHPHIFGDVQVESAAEVADLWQKIKQSEKAGQPRPKSVLDQAKKSLPALMRAQDLQKKAAKTGFDWPDAEAVLQKVQEEAGELALEIAKRNAGADNATALEEEFGDLLFVLVNLARHGKIDAQLAMLRANAKFERRFKQMEVLIAAEQKDLGSLTLSEMDAFWDQVKAHEKSAN